MPHYYFHLRTTDGPERDDEGITFPGLDGAKADALLPAFLRWHPKNYRLATKAGS